MMGGSQHNPWWCLENLDGFKKTDRSSQSPGTPRPNPSFTNSLASRALRLCVRNGSCIRWWMFTIQHRFSRCLTRYYFFPVPNLQWHSALSAAAFVTIGSFKAESSVI
jgi:hypothetical protein